MIDPPLDSNCHENKGGSITWVNLAISESQKSKIFAAYGGVFPLKIDILNLQIFIFFAACGGVLPLEILVLNAKILIFSASGGVLLLGIMIFKL